MYEDQSLNTNPPSGLASECKNSKSELPLPNANAPYDVTT